MFSLEQLLFSVAADVRTNVEILETVLPMLKEVYEREIKERAEIQVKTASRATFRFYLAVLSIKIYCILIRDLVFVF